MRANRDTTQHVGRDVDETRVCQRLVVRDAVEAAWDADLWLLAIGAMTPLEAARSVLAACPLARIRVVSEMCQVPIETPLEHRDPLTHTEEHRCRGKCLRR